MESSHTTGNSSTATPGTKTRPSSGLVPNHASAFAMPVPTHHGLTASVDNTPPASVASTSASVPTSSASSSRGTDRPTHVSPFAHSLNSGETAGYPQFSTRLAHDHFNPAHLPMTPGEEMVFDRGLLFASHQPSTRSDPTNALRSAPLPEVPAIDRSSSDPENSAEQNHSGSLPRQIRSTPIHIPAIHHSSPMPSNRASIVHSQGFPSRSPSPNPSTTTQGFAMSHPTPESDISLDHQANGGTHLPYTRPSATPAALRPDSVCSFPDSSPLMAPNVLAAVDARLKESSRQRALAAQPSSSSPRPPRPRSAVLGATHSISSNANSPASSLAPVTTHLAVLQNSESITSKEDLYDILNRDDDDDDVFGSDSEGLGKPRPGFISSGHRSSKSSRPNSSYSSSSAGGGGIELNAKGERLLAASLPRPVQAKVNREGSIKGSKRMELVSAAMVTKDQKENYNSSDSDFGGRILMEKSEWLKRKSRTSRKWRGICCVVGILALVGVIAGIVLGFVTRKGKIDGLAPLPNPDAPPKDTPLITQFTPNPNLHKSFYGLDYNPANALMPWCGATLQNVVDDVIIMSQLTNRIRLYGMDCNQAELTFQAIQALKLNNTMKVVLTLWVDTNQTTVQRQYDTLFKVLDTYGTDMVQGISVGNEVLFRKDMTLAALGSLMSTVRTNIRTRYNKSIPVFTSEIGNNLNSALAEVSDELSGNLHPYFAGVAAAEGANWTFAQYNYTIIGNPTKSGIKGAISEVGWPSAPATAIDSPSAVPGVDNLQIMINDFICQANTQGIPYYWFEFKDEPWKTDPSVPVEPNWGLFDKDGNLKVTIPNCVVA